MSRVRWAVRVRHDWVDWEGDVGTSYGRQLTDARDVAADIATDYGGNVVRVTQYDAAETAARRAVIEAARVVVLLTDEQSAPISAMRDALVRMTAQVHALEALELTEAMPTVTLTGEQATEVRLVGKSKRKAVEK